MRHQLNSISVQSGAFVRGDDELEVGRDRSLDLSHFGDDGEEQSAKDRLPKKKPL